MRKNIILILLTLSQYAFSQANIENKTSIKELELKINLIEKENQKLITLENEHIELVRSIDLLKKEFKDIKDYKKQQEVLISQTSQTIQNQNSLIGSFGIIYTILTIIIALIAVGLPIITYQFGIRPSRVALKELENNLDKKVADYLIETRKSQIKKSIEHLKGENAELKAQAVSFLSLTQHEGFSDQELFEFYRLIKSGLLSDSHIGTMAYLLSSRINEHANEIFGDKEQLKNNAIKSAAYQYIPKVGIDKFLIPLKSFLKDNKNQFGEFLTLLTFSNMYSPKMGNEIFNKKELIDTLTNETLIQMKPSIKQTLENMKIKIDDFEKSYLSDKINNASA